MSRLRLALVSNLVIILPPLPILAVLTFASLFVVGEFSWLLMLLCLCLVGAVVFTILSLRGGRKQFFGLALACCIPFYIATGWMIVVWWMDRGLAAAFLDDRQPVAAQEARAEIIKRAGNDAPPIAEIHRLVEALDTNRDIKKRMEIITLLDTVGYGDGVVSRGLARVVRETRDDPASERLHQLASTLLRRLDPDIFDITNVGYREVVPGRALTFTVPPTHAVYEGIITTRVSGLLIPEVSSEDRCEALAASRLGPCLKALIAAAARTDLVQMQIVQPGFYRSNVILDGRSLSRILEDKLPWDPGPDAGKYPEDPVKAPLDWCAVSEKLDVTSCQTLARSPNESSSRSRR